MQKTDYNKRAKLENEKLLEGCREKQERQNENKNKNKNERSNIEYSNEETKACRNKRQWKRRFAVKTHAIIFHCSTNMFFATALIERKHI